MTMMNEIHFYRFRHLFMGDDCIGKFEGTDKTVRLFDAFAGHKDTVKTWFMRVHSIPVTVLIGDEEVKQAAPLREFPEDIRALMTPEMGHLTPEVIAWARENFSEAEFEQRYRGAVAYSTKPAAAIAPVESTTEPDAPPPTEETAPPAKAKKTAKPAKAPAVSDPTE